MHTTLDFLKQNSACKPGYTEMVTFFGLSPKIKHVDLPLGLCSMVLKSDNFEWLLDNSLIIDMDQYAAFRRRWLVGFMQWFAWEKISMPTGTDKRAMRPYLQQMRDVQTYEQAEAIVQLMQTRTFSGLNFNNRLDSDYQGAWTIPYHFIRAVCDMFEASPTHNTRRQMEREDKTVPDYYLGWKKGQHIIKAHLFEEDPYTAAIKFLTEHPYISSKAMKHKLGFIDEKPQMTFTLEDPRHIFATYRMLAKGSISESDIRQAMAVVEGGDGDDDDGEDDED